MISNTSGNTSYTHTNHKKDRKLFCELSCYTFHNIHHSCPLHYFKYFSLTQSRSNLKIVDKVGSFRLNKIINTLRRLKSPNGGSPERITRAKARCLAITLL